MSFWKKAGDLALKAGSAALSEAKAAGERTKQYKEVQKPAQRKASRVFYCPM